MSELNITQQNQMEKTWEFAQSGYNFYCGILRGVF